MNDDEKKDLWVEFAKAAIHSYEIPDEVDGFKSLVEDVATTCGAIADAMVEEFEGRFEDLQPERADRPRRRRSRSEREEPET
jgi:hypothetical protein